MQDEAVAQTKGSAFITGPCVFQDEPAQVGKDQEMMILKDMNAFEDDHERFMNSLKGVE